MGGVSQKARTTSCDTAKNTVNKLRNRQTSQPLRRNKRSVSHKYKCERKKTFFENSRDIKSKFRVLDNSDLQIE